jgi:hypothetical protein
MVWFSIPDCLIFLPQSLPILLVVDTPVMVISSVVASVAKTINMS